MNVRRQLGLSAKQDGTCFAPDHWRGDRDATPLLSHNPATGAVLGQIYGSAAGDYEPMMRAAQAAQRAWADVPAPRRGDLVRVLGEKLRAHKRELGMLVSMEMGKILAEGEGEVQEMIDMADFAVGLSRMLYGKTIPSERPDHRMLEQWHPLGVVGVISAFNFPVAVWAWNAFLAAVCGNAVIWKPSHKAPLCAVAVQHLCNEAMAELGTPHVFSLFIPSEHAQVECLVDDRRVPLISFTGSSHVGQRVSARVAQRFGRSLLECSGNNAVIVDATADLNLAERAIVFGAVGTAGQRCTTTRRLFVQERIYDKLLRRLRSAYAGVKIGDPVRPGVLMGPLIDDAAVIAYEKAIASAQADGGVVLYGGKAVRRRGHFVQPTLIAVDRQVEAVKHETFAPILYVMRYRKLEQAIALQNDVPQGLSSSLFTNDLKSAELFLSSRGSDCGIANVNLGTSGAEIGGAFGGEKETGGGREAGSDCWKNYMRRQTNTINWSDALPLAQGIRFGAPKKR